MEEEGFFKWCGRGQGRGFFLGGQGGGEGEEGEDVCGVLGKEDVFNFLFF